MTAAGWYPDPHAAAELRYWDGSRWTEHVASRVQQQAAPPAPGPAMAAVDDADGGDPGAQDVPIVAFSPLDAEVKLGLGRRRRLHLDMQALRWGDEVVPFDSIVWFGYLMTRQFVNGVPTSTNYEIRLGHARGTTKVRFAATGHTTASANEQGAVFATAVAAVHELVAPRLLAGYLRDVAVGHVVTIGPMSFSAGGLTRSGKVRGDLTVPWSDVSGASVGQGVAAVFRFDPTAKKGHRRIATMRLIEPNAPIVADLVDRLRAAFPLRG